jgi:hypothetical protein
MHFLLIFLLALEGGAFSGPALGPSFHSAPAVAGNPSHSVAVRPNDGQTGQPDTGAKTAPVTSTPVAKSVPRVRNDGQTGPPEHH